MSDRINITDRFTWVPSSENQSTRFGSEKMAQAVDGSVDTKWLAFEPAPTATAASIGDAPHVFEGFEIGSGNDYPQRDPGLIRVEDSHGNELFSAEGLEWPNRKQVRQFMLPAPTVVTGLKFFFGCIAGTITQMSEIRLLGYPYVAPPPTEDPRPRKIYGHYMGCFAAGAGAIQYHATTGIAVMDPPSEVLAEQKNALRPLLGDWAQTSIGGSYRNFALAPQNRNLSVREAAELEIKRAIRIGLDGFTFDAWAGGKGARDQLDAMFEICEEQDLPFTLGITLDTASMNHTDADLAVYTGNVWEKTIKWLIDKHGESPNLARRNGKVLIMGYQSIWPGEYAISQHVNAAMPAPAFTAEQRAAEKTRLRTSEEGWAMIVDAYAQMEVNVGVPIFWEFCLNGFYIGTTGNPPNPPLATAAAYLAKHFPALGLFEWVSGTPDIAAAVIAEGAEWSHPMKMQYENFGYYQAASPGLNWVRGDWNRARNQPSTLIQHITWNDYHEATNLSPGYNTRYAYYDLTAEFIKAWKQGSYAPEVATADHDKVYIFSHKYAHGTPMFPFKAVARADNKIEVVTILPKPATMRAPGRTTVDGETEWEAPAGMSYKQFPLTPGPVSVELMRGGAVEIRLKSPEPVSDRPFRQDTGKVAICTECAGHWAKDFPADGPMFLYSEYGDVDGDGLPNWFEMLFYGKFGTMATATAADANADPAGTGKTNLQHYLDQTDPFKVPPPPEVTWEEKRELLHTYLGTWSPETVQQQRVNTEVWRIYELSSDGEIRNETQQEYDKEEERTLTL